MLALVLSTSCSPDARIGASPREVLMRSLVRSLLDSSGFGLVALCAIAACGGGSSGGSEFEGPPPASGGAAGQGGLGLIIGPGRDAGPDGQGGAMQGSGGGGLGGASNLTLHQCPSSPDPPCPTRLIENT